MAKMDRTIGWLSYIWFLQEQALFLLPPQTLGEGTLKHEGAGEDVSDQAAETGETT